MINDKIENLREKLNELIASGAEYEEIYKVSTELDEYITKFYLEQQSNV